MLYWLCKGTIFFANCAQLSLKKCKTTFFDHFAGYKKKRPLGLPFLYFVSFGLKCLLLLKETILVFQILLVHRNIDDFFFGCSFLNNLLFRLSL